MEMKVRPNDATNTPSRVNEGDNIVDLVSKLTTQSATLAQDQLNLVQAEIREGLHDVQKGIAGLLGAAVLGIAGLGVTLMGIAYLIGDALGDRDLATLIVGLVTIAIAGVLYAGAKSKIDAQNLKPTRTIDTAERMPDAATGDAHKI